MEYLRYGFDLIQVALRVYLWISWWYALILANCQHEAQVVHKQHCEAKVKDPHLTILERGTDYRRYDAIGQQHLKYGESEVRPN